MDTERLHSDIKSHLQDNPTSAGHLDHQSQSDPKIQTVYYDIPDAYTSRKPGIYDYVHVLQYLHNHPITGHFAQMKTPHAVHRQYYWPGLQSYVKDYCKSCTTCSHAKPVCHQPYGLLKQLPVPEKPWNSILLDFIEKILPSSSSYTAILVIIDHLSTQGLFILTHNMITSQFSTSSPNMVSQATSLPIMDPSLSHTSSSPLELHSTWSFISLLDTTLREMDRWNKWTRLCNSTFESTATTSKTTGTSFFP